VREQDGGNIGVPKSWCLFEAIKCFLKLNNNRRCIWAFRPAFGQGYIDIIVIDLRIEKTSDHIQMIDVPAIFYDLGDEIPKGGEFSNRDVSFSEVRLFVAFNY